MAHSVRKWFWKIMTRGGGGVTSLKHFCTAQFMHIFSMKKKIYRKMHFDLVFVSLPQTLF